MKMNEQRPVVAVQPENQLARAITDGDIVLASVDVPAAPSRVIEAMMTSECEQWWGVRGVYTVDSWRAALVAGGAWCLNVSEREFLQRRLAACRD